MNGLCRVVVEEVVAEVDLASYCYCSDSERHSAVADAMELDTGSSEALQYSIVAELGLFHHD